MATARPLVSVFKFNHPDQKMGEGLIIPAVFNTPVRPDIVRFVHTNMSKNRRQPYAVSDKSGYNNAAKSWGTGRAVARIPRVNGGGTSRSGQGAFGNMCKGGGMFAPTKVWRRWHRKININHKRHAVASALAASAITSMVMARGHQIEKVPELPLVVSAGAERMIRTKNAVDLFNALGCGADVKRSIESKHIRPGCGKARNRKYIIRRGPLVVYAEDKGICRAFRNIPGVDLCPIDRLNLLKLAPGGTAGRLILWTAPAFTLLTEMFGDYSTPSTMKKGYRLPRPIMANSDLARVINSDEIQSVLRPKIMPRVVGSLKNIFFKLFSSPRRTGATP